MKYTILNLQQSTLLENLVLKYGQIVTFDNILEQTRDSLSRQATKNLIFTLTKNGWLIRIKKGLYAISDLTNRGFLSLSSYLVANLLVKDSYVSFESALHYQGMFDQLTNQTISVSLNAYQAVTLQGTRYSFVKTKQEYFFGWQEVLMDNKTVRVASAEKALIDMVNFHKSTYAIDLVIEKIREHRRELDFKRLREYLKKFSITTIKIFGFIFDLTGIDSGDLHILVKNKRGAQRMLSGSKKFNAKWRLYYEEYFDKYQTAKSV